MPNSRFKIQILDGEGKQRWVEADQVFTYLAEAYTKTIPNGDIPKLYKDKVEHFFSNVDKDWLEMLTLAYENVDIEKEMKAAKLWLLSNSSHPKRNFKKFLNNWMSRTKTEEKERVMFGEY